MITQTSSILLNTQKKRDLQNSSQKGSAHKKTIRHSPTKSRDRLIYVVIFLILFTQEILQSPASVLLIPQHEFPSCCIPTSPLWVPFPFPLHFLQMNELLSPSSCDNTKMQQSQSTQIPR